MLQIDCLKCNLDLSGCCKQISNLFLVPHSPAVNIQILLWQALLSFSHHSHWTVWRFWPVGAADERRFGTRAWFGEQLKRYNYCCVCLNCTFGFYKINMTMSYAFHCFNFFLILFFTKLLLIVWKTWYMFYCQCKLHKPLNLKYCLN